MGNTSTKEGIANNITQLIGNTPMLRLNKVNDGFGNIVLKMEGENPAKSVKDRIALGMIEEAEKRGDIQPGDILVEATSGNTGIALAMVAASKGYTFIGVMPDSMSVERRMMMKAYGAELILTPASLGIKASFDMADKIQKERGAKQLSQFENPDNPKIHRETTGPEIWNQTDGKIDFLVSGVGTGGTITGATQYLKSRNGSLKSFAVEPAESPVLSGGKKGPHPIQGLGAGFVPVVYDASIVDEVLTCSSADAIKMTKRLALEEGILSGISAGAAVHAGVRLAQRAGNHGKLVVVILPSFGERYFSLPMYADLYKECAEMKAQEAKEV